MLSSKSMKVMWAIMMLTLISACSFGASFQDDRIELSKELGMKFTHGPKDAEAIKASTEHKKRSEIAFGSTTKQTEKKAFSTKKEISCAQKILPLTENEKFCRFVPGGESRSESKILQSVASIEAIKLSDLANSGQTSLCMSFQDIPDFGYVQIYFGVCSMESFNEYPAESGFDFAWWQNPDRSNGYRIFQFGELVEGDVFHLEGYMATTAQGERVIMPFWYSPTQQRTISILRNGFPLSRPLFVPLKTSAVPQRPSALVKIRGKIVTEPEYIEPDSCTYIIDDGSPLETNDSSVRGYKVVDSFHSLNTPVSKGDTVAITGYFSNEKIFYRSTDGWNTIPSKSEEKYTVSGKIYADADAAGQTVWIGCEGGSTTSIFDQTGTASYSLTLNAGDWNIYARTPGYWSRLWWVTLDQNKSVDFFTGPLFHYDENNNMVVQKEVLEVVTKTQSIKRDGISTVEGYALLRDFEGKRWQGKNVTLTTSAGELVSCENKTDQMGKCSFVLKSSTKSETATIVAKSDNLTAGGLFFFHNEGDPIVYIVNPVDQSTTGQDPITVSGKMRVDVITGNLNIDENSNITTRDLLIDDVICGSFYEAVSETDNNGNLYEKFPTIDTSCFSNGEHVLSARVTDDKGNISLSNKVKLVFANTISERRDINSEIIIDDPEIVPGVYSGSAKIDQPGNWILTIRNCDDDSIIKTKSVAGPCVASIEWDGKIDNAYVESLFEVTLEPEQVLPAETVNAPAQGADIEKKTMTYLSVSRIHTKALICGIFRDEEDWSAQTSKNEMIAVKKACIARGVTFTTIKDPIWHSGKDTKGDKTYRKGLEWYLSQGYRYFFISSHGIMKDFGATISIPAISLADGEEVVGNNYFLASWMRPTNPAISDCRILLGQYQIVEINACYSAGTITNHDDSLAQGFHVSNQELEDDSGAYIGWYGKYLATTINQLPAWSVTPNGTGWTRGFWRRLGEGNTVQQAIEKSFSQPYLPEDGWMKDYLSWPGMSAWSTWLE